METTTLAQAMLRKFQKASKYGNRKTEYNGRFYMSRHEARCAEDIDLLRKAKNQADRVVDVQYQVPYILQDGFTDKSGKKHRPIIYLSDFVCVYADGHTDVIDAKSAGTITDVYKLKKKMLLYRYGIEIKEWF